MRFRTRQIGGRRPLAACPQDGRGLPRLVLNAVVTTLAVTLAATTASVTLTATAAQASAPGDAVIAQTNAARAKAGLPAYQVSADLTAVASRWAAHLAGQGAISHNPALRTQVTNWRYVGENVGSGGSEQAIQDSFMRSPTHRDNILDHDFTQMGVGVATAHNALCDCDILYVVVDFRQPKAAAPATKPVSKPAPKAAPRPAAPAAQRTAKTGPAAKAPATQDTKPVTEPVGNESPAKADPTPTIQAAADAALEAGRLPGATGDPITRALEFTTGR